MRVLEKEVQVGTGGHGARGGSQVSRIQVVQRAIKIINKKKKTKEKEKKRTFILFFCFCVFILVGNKKLIEKEFHGL